MAPPELAWLYTMGDRLPENSIAIELGAWFGRSSAALFLGSRGLRTIVSIDTWQGTPTEPAHDKAKSINVCAAFVDNMVELGVDIKPYQKGLTGPQYLRMDALDAAALFDEESVSLLFIDDDHRRPGLALDVWLPKMRPDSIVAGHDYFCFYDFIQPQVHDRVHHINQIVHSVWIRYWRTSPLETPPTWYL